MKNRIVTATEFRSKCLALIDEVDRYGITVTVTKRGKPAGLLEPIKRVSGKLSLKTGKKGA
jgi:prevent-host-death family protein